MGGRCSACDYRLDRMWKQLCARMVHNPDLYIDGSAISSVNLAGGNVLALWEPHSNV